jgi:hypothetical protein
MHTPRDHSDQLHEPRKSSWALWIIIFVLIAFGIFWYSETHKARDLSRTSTSTPATSPVDSLQAAVINSEIPDFAKEF